MCYIVSKDDGLAVRKSPGTGGELIFRLAKGESLPSDCAATAGGQYTACGSASFWWVRVYSGRAPEEYVALECVDWFFNAAAKAGEKDALVLEMVEAETKQDAITPPRPKPAPPGEG